jgi:hypothetical protein
MASAGKITTAAARRAALLKAANLRTRAGAARYLRAIGVNPHHFVIQRGIRNYAGAKCPGARWSCTSTAHPVIQIASAGGSNTFQCSTATCAVVQATAAPASPKPATNKATCVKTTGPTQDCVINQTSLTANNVAIVVETSKTSGLTQTVSYTAEITQHATGSSNTNTACVLQNTNVDGSTTAKKGASVNVTLNAHQSVTISQDSVGGKNAVQAAKLSDDCGAANSALAQNQTLTSSATGPGSITQNQNAAGGDANVKLDIAQNSTSGVNTSAFTQTNSLTAIATTPVGPVNQTQSSSDGGLLATVNQFSSGFSTSSASQTETQCEHAQAAGPLTCNTPNPPPYTFTQVQYGPVRKGLGTSTQGNSPADTFTVNQSSTQNNDSGNGQTNTVQGDCVTSGACTVTQDTSVDGATTHNEQTGQAVDTQITCSGSDCASSGPGTTSTLTISLTGLTVSNTDVAESGFGGMRGDGNTGSIMANGITGPVAHAFLYWNGPTNSSDFGANASVMLNGEPVTGTNIGVASDNCWNFQNSQSYRADVTSIVTGNGDYSLGNFRKTGDEGVIADINGVSLIVFYDDGNSSNDRSLVAWNGNDSNFGFGPSYPFETWDETISGVPYPGSGSATLDLVVSDGQTYADGPLMLNNQPLAAAGHTFDGTTTPAGSSPSGSLWDVKPFDITPYLSNANDNTLHLTSDADSGEEFSDCLSLVVAAANVPASAPPILLASTTGLQQPSSAQLVPTGSSPRGDVPNGGGHVRR